MVQASLAAAVEFTPITGADFRSQVSPDLGPAPKNAKPPCLRFGLPVEAASTAAAVGNRLITPGARWSPEPELLCTLEKNEVLEKRSLPAADVFFS